MKLTKAEEREAEKYLWLFDYIDRSEKLNQFLWDKGLDVWLADAPLCLDHRLLTEPFRENIHPSCSTEINVIIESRDRALKLFLTDVFARASALDSLNSVPNSLRRHNIFKGLFSEVSPEIIFDRTDFFLITNWVVLNTVAKTEDGPMLIPGLAFHTDQSRADDVARQVGLRLSHDTIRKRWNRGLGLIPVTKENTPNLFKQIGGQMKMLPIKSKKHSP